MKKFPKLQTYLFTSRKILIVAKCPLHPDQFNWKINSSRIVKIKELILLPLIFLIDKETRLAIKNLFTNLFKIRSQKVVMINCDVCKVENNENSNCLVFQRDRFDLNKSEVNGIRIIVLNREKDSHLETFLNPGLSPIATNYRIKSRTLAMARILEEGNLTLQRGSKFVGIKPSSQKTFEPSPLTFRLLFQLAISKYLRKKHPAHNVWHLEYAKKTSQTEMEPWTRLQLDSRFLAADPFLCEIKGRLICLFEGIGRKDRYGKIYSVEIPSNIAHNKEISLKPKLELDLGSHASFPCTFRHENETYMITESNSLKETFIHKYNAKNESWELFASILKGRNLLDPILFREGNLFYILASERVNEDSLGSAVLKLFSSNLINEGWEEKPENFVWDDRTARNAGSIPEGWVFQDIHSGIYGHRLWVKKKRVVNSICGSELYKLDFCITHGFKSHHLTEYENFFVRDISRI